jgi:glutamate racemase
VSELPSAPIAIFDSGMGGLSVLRAIHALLPTESLIYCADSLHAPYGERDDDFIADRTTAVCDWLVAQGAKALVVACNTATTQTIHLIRARLQMPVVGVEPGLKPAALRSATHVAGVLATAGTLRSEKFNRLLAEYSSQCRYICAAGHGLVEAIERGETDTPELEALLRRYVEPMLGAGADTLVLGCTHYPFLAPVLERVVAGRMELLDTSVAIARQLDRLLSADALYAAPGQAGVLRFCSTGDGRHLQSTVQSLLQMTVAVERVRIGSRRGPLDSDNPAAQPPELLPAAGTCG